VDEEFKADGNAKEVTLGPALDARDCVIKEVRKWGRGSYFAKDVATFFPPRVL
jgi:hypothetical protein